MKINVFAVTIERVIDIMCVTYVNQSTVRSNATSSVGIPRLDNTITIMTYPERGIDVLEMEINVAVTLKNI